MKKKIAIIALALMMLSVLTGCCSHVWYAASCTAPKTCQECGKTEGEALGHTWEAASCTMPKTCTTCKEIEGEALGHDWEEATTEAPKTCKVCAETEGEKIDTDPRFTTAATKDFQGKWSCDVVLTGDMLGTTGYLDEVKCTLIYEFKNNGDMTQTIQIEDQIAFMDAIKKMSLDVAYSALEEQGYSKTQAEEAYLELYDMTIEEYVSKAVNEMDLEEFFGAFTNEGVYYVTENKIWTAQSWLNEFESSDYTLEGDQLVIDEDTLEEGGEPFQWKRVVE